MRISDWSSDVCSSDLDAARRAEDGKLFLQPLGRVERAAGVPEGRVGALGRLVVKDEEIADIDIFAQRLAIVAVALGVAEGAGREQRHQPRDRSEEHTSELQSLMRISYAVFCLKKKKNTASNDTVMTRDKRTETVT